MKEDHKRGYPRDVSRINKRGSGHARFLRGGIVAGGTDLENVNKPLDDWGSGAQDEPHSGLGKKARQLTEGGDFRPGAARGVKKREGLFQRGLTPRV